MLSSLNSAKYQETLSLGLQFPTGEVLVARSSHHGLSRRDRTGAVAVGTPRSEVREAEAARERCPLTARRAWMLRAVRGGRRPRSGAAAVHGRNGTGQGGFCPSFKYTFLSKYLSCPKLCLLILVRLHLILL